MCDAMERYVIVSVETSSFVFHERVQQVALVTFCEGTVDIPVDMMMEMWGSFLRELEY